LTFVSDVELWHNYICEMRRPGAFADNLIVISTVWFIGRDIVLVLENGDGHPTSCRYRPPKRLANSGPELFLGYIENVYCQALVPIRTVLHDTVCSMCDRKAKSLRMHLSHNPICRSSYNMQDLDELTDRLRRFEKKQRNPECNADCATECGEKPTQSAEFHETPTRNAERRAKPTRKVGCQEKCDQKVESGRKTALNTRRRKKPARNAESRGKTARNCQERQEILRQKRIQFYHKHREEICLKRMVYYRQHRDTILQKRNQFYRDHQEEIRQKRIEHYRKNRDEVRQKSALYYQKFRDQILQRKTSRNGKKSLRTTSQVLYIIIINSSSS